MLCRPVFNSSPFKEKVSRIICSKQGNSKGKFLFCGNNSFYDQEYFIECKCLLERDISNLKLELKLLEESINSKYSNLFLSECNSRRRYFHVGFCVNNDSLLKEQDFLLEQEKYLCNLFNSSSIKELENYVIEQKEEYHRIIERIGYLNHEKELFLIEVESSDCISERIRLKSRETELKRELKSSHQVYDDLKKKHLYLLSREDSISICEKELMNLLNISRRVDHRLNVIEKEYFKEKELSDLILRKNSKPSVFSNNKDSKIKEKVLFSEANDSLNCDIGLSKVPNSELLTPFYYNTDYSRETREKFELFDDDSKFENENINSCESMNKGNADHVSTNTFVNDDFSDEFLSENEESINEPYATKKNEADEFLSENKKIINEPYVTKKNEADEFLSENEESINEPYVTTKNEAHEFLSENEESINEPYVTKKNEANEFLSENEESINEPYVTTKNEEKALSLNNQEFLNETGKHLFAPEMIHFLVSATVEETFNQFFSLYMYSCSIKESLISEEETYEKDNNLLNLFESNIETIFEETVN